MVILFCFFAGFVPSSNEFSSAVISSETASKFFKKQSQQTLVDVQKQSIEDLHFIDNDLEDLNGFSINNNFLQLFHSRKILCFSLSLYETKHFQTQPFYILFCNLKLDFMC